MKKIQNSSGKTSSILLVLAVALIILIIVVYVVIRIAAVKNPAGSGTTTSTTTVGPPKPVYETTIGDVRFVFESAVDMGNVLSSQSGAFGQNLTTTEKFIKVTIGAQNTGKTNIERSAWDLGNIVDADGRNFVTINDQAYYLLPNPNLCGALLKPDFEPTPCVKYYEVSKASTGLKIGVDYLGSNSSKKQEKFIDLLVTQ